MKHLFCDLMKSYHKSRDLKRFYSSTQFRSALTKSRLFEIQLSKWFKYTFGSSNLQQRFLHVVQYCSASRGAPFLGRFFSGTWTQSIFTLLSSVAVWLHPPLCGKSKELSPALCVKAWSTVSQRRPDVLDVKRMGEEEKLCVTLRGGGGGMGSNHSNQ